MRLALEIFRGPFGLKQSVKQSLKSFWHLNQRFLLSHSGFDPFLTQNYLLLERLEMRNISILWVLDFKIFNFFLSSSLSSYILSQAVRSQVVLHYFVGKSSISLSSSGTFSSSMFVQVTVLSHFPSLPSRYPPSSIFQWDFPLSFKPTLTASLRSFWFQVSSF